MTELEFELQIFDQDTGTRVREDWERICAWDGCERPATRTLLCNMHHLRRKRGSPAMDAPAADDFEGRFWIRVDKSGPDECWPWLGKINWRGYGELAIKSETTRSGNTTAMAHRVAYELTIRPIPEGLTLDHLCCKTDCCNPAHLDPCTRAENVRRASLRRTHCKNGHEFTPENTYIKKNGRRCRQCALDYEAARWRARKATA